MVRCNNADCVYCVGGECMEDDVDLISESSTWCDFDEGVMKREQTGILHCESYLSL